MSVPTVRWVAACCVGVKDGKIINIEGNPDSPINRGTLCPKGAQSFQLAVNPLRSTRVLYRRPGGADWEEITLDWAMDMIAERVKKTRDETFHEFVTVKGCRAGRTVRSASTIPRRSSRSAARRWTTSGTTSMPS